MKIAIIGQQDFGKAVLEAFLARGDTVAGVFIAPEKEGAKADPMKVVAQEKGLKVFQFPSLKSPEATQAFLRYWRVIRPGSGAIRRSWLAAIRRRVARTGSRSAKSS